MALSVINLAYMIFMPKAIKECPFGRYFVEAGRSYVPGGDTRVLRYSINFEAQSANMF